MRCALGSVVRHCGVRAHADFILVPGPYAMAVFTFIAQPLFAIVAIGYLLKVRADLKQRGL